MNWIVFFLSFFELLTGKTFLKQSSSINKQTNNLWFMLSYKVKNIYVCYSFIETFWTIHINSYKRNYYTNSAKSFLIWTFLLIFVSTERSVYSVTRAGISFNNFNNRTCSWAINLSTNWHIFAVVIFLLRAIWFLFYE